MSEIPQPAAPPAAESTFKIGASGTHASQGGSNVTNDTPPPPPGPAEPAPPEVKEPAKTENTATPPAEPGTGEPPKATNSAPLGSSKPAPASADVPPPATQPAATAPPLTLEEVLKAQGFDEQFINLAKTYKAEGNISRYAQAMSTDYNKMPPEEIHKLKVQRDYPGATPEQLEILYETEIKDKYKLDPDSFDPAGKEAKAGRLKMELDAKKLQTEFTAENEKYKLPSKDITAELQQQQEAQIQENKKIMDAFLSHPYSQSVITDKKLVLKDLGQGIPDFTMELADPSEVSAILTDPAVYQKYMRDEKGNVDPEANFQAAAFIMNRKAFCQALINQGKMLGKEELIEEKYNPPKPSGSAATPNKESLDEAFVSRGKAGKGG